MDMPVWVVYEGKARVGRVGAWHPALGVFGVVIDDTFEDTPYMEAVHVDRYPYEVFATKDDISKYFFGHPITDAYLYADDYP